jgi:cyclopropane fatty-acyl-phospholipid synthase-like methyltransferase
MWFYLAYYQKPIWDTGISPQELLSFISSHPPGKALDLGCGTGTNVITLAQAGWRVTGIDYIPRAIHIARKKARQNGIQADFILRDVTHLDSLANSYDLILDIGCFHGLNPKDRPNYIAAIQRLLAETGTFLLYVFFKPPGEERTPGVTEADIIYISQIFRLINRKNGAEREIRPSAWLSFQKSE